MARQFVVLALIFFAIAVMVSAKGGYASPSPSPVTVPAVGLGPAPDNDIIGTTDGATYGASPVGGPVSEGTFAGLSPAESPTSDSTAMEAFTFAPLLVSAAVASFFF